MTAKWVDDPYNKICLVITLSLIGQGLITIIMVINLIIVLIYSNQAIGVVLVAGREIVPTCNTVTNAKRQEMNQGVTTQSSSYLQPEEHRVPEEHQTITRDRQGDTRYPPPVTAGHSLSLIHI